MTRSITSCSFSSCMPGTEGGRGNNRRTAPSAKSSRGQAAGADMQLEDARTEAPASASALPVRLPCIVQRSPQKHPARQAGASSPAWGACQPRTWSISSRLVTRPMRSRPTPGASSATASTISLCSSALERVASLPPCTRTWRGEVRQTTRTHAGATVRQQHWPARQATPWAGTGRVGQPSRRGGIAP